MGLGLLTAQAQTDDLPGKERIESMITLPAKQLYNSQIIYEAKEAELKNFLLQGWRYDRRKNCLSTGRYGSDTDVKAISKPFTVPALAKGEQLYLNITEAFSLESDYDFGKVLISADGGETWEKIYRISGKSEKRTAQVNVSDYAGQTVELALNLQSDASFESDGWEVYGLSFEKGSVKSSIELNSSARSLTNPEIVITGVHDENFPEAVYVDFQLLENGTQVTNYNFSDFNFQYAYDLTSEVSLCNERLYGPDETSRPVDILFVFDNSSSMGDNQEDVEDGIIDFVDNLQTSSDARFGLLRFGYAGANDMVLETTMFSSVPVNFTSDKTDFKNNVLSRNTSNSGGTEQGYNALDLGLTANFRPNAQKVLVLITDENVVGSDGVTPNTNQGSVSQNQIITKLNQDGATVYSWIPSDANYNETYAKVSRETGGKRYDIENDDFSDLATDVENAIAGTYTLRYCPTEQEADGVERSITISLTDDNSVVDEGEFIPEPDEEYIIREENTIDLSKVKQPQNQPINYCFIVKDNLGPKAVSTDLFVKQINSTSYTSIAMTENTSTPAKEREWCATVPGTFAQDPGFQYYAVATYGDGHVLKSPSTREQFFAWTQPIDPNEPPVITIISTQAASPCNDYNLRFNVFDNTNGFEEVKLFYKEKDAPGGFTNVINVYDYVSGTRPTDVDFNSIMVPVTGPGVEYYIVAYDNYGISGFAGTPTAPLEIIPTVPTSITTSKSMNLDFSSVQINCTGIQIGDELRANYIDDCGAQALAGSKTITDLQDVYLEIFGDDDPNSKNGYDEGETLVVYVVRNGQQHRIYQPKTFSDNGYESYFGININPIVDFELKYDDNNEVVANNDITPSTLEGTDFGTVTSSVTHSFSFTQSGCSQIAFLGIDGSNKTDFDYTINTNTGDITVEYLATKDATSTVSVNTTSGTYQFDVVGSAVNCVEEIQYGTVIIPNGDASPSIAEGTDFELQDNAVIRSFDLLSTGCNTTISSVSSNNAEFTVTHTATSLDVTYQATADASATITVNTSAGTSYTFAVTGDANSCNWNYEFSDNGADITDGDQTPSTADGTDFGTVSSVTTHTFDLVQTGCSPAITVNSASASGTAFSTSVSGTSVDVTFDNSGTATETITIITSDGSFAFDVTASSASSTCTQPHQFENPLSIYAGYASIDVEVEAASQSGQSSSCNVSSVLYNVTTGNPVTNLTSETLTHWQTTPTYIEHGFNLPTLTLGHKYAIETTITNNGSCSGVFVEEFLTKNP